ncbi:MAG TPA: prenyltransferase/squalene oxidase repeat-containing protein [Pirellulales bacterium]|nr:prenyltransferase/squalene oxidase repeat-containing protein [Pirellulales bacterium]
MVDPDRLLAAYETARCDLLAECAPAGHWTGNLSSSPLATAAAICALAIVERHAPIVGGRLVDEGRQCRLSSTIIASLRYLARHQNADGGWGDRDAGSSKVAATYLARSAFALTCVPANRPFILEQADACLKANGWLRGLDRQDELDAASKTAVVSAAALARLVPWRKVNKLMPRGFDARRTTSWADGERNALKHALEQLRSRYRKSWNPLSGFAERRATQARLDVIASEQAAGGFGGSIVETSMVVMCLAASGQASHAIVCRGLEYLFDSVGADGSWPAYGDLGVRQTSSALLALDAAGEELDDARWLDGLLIAQQRSPEASSAAGWGFSESGGATSYDTALAISALVALANSQPLARPKVERALSNGVTWLLQTQRADGGWRDEWDPSGRDHLPIDPETTAQATIALVAWHRWRERDDALISQLTAAVERGARFLDQHQQTTGFWRARPLATAGDVPQDALRATCRVLQAYRALGRLETESVRRALTWLVERKATEGSWSPRISEMDELAPAGIVEATALAASTLLVCGQTPAHELAAIEGIEYLITAAEGNRHGEPTVFWVRGIECSDTVASQVAAVRALGQAACRFVPNYRESLRRQPLKA